MTVWTLRISHMTSELSRTMTRIATFAVETTPVFLAWNSRSTRYMTDRDRQKGRLRAGTDIHTAAWRGDIALIKFEFDVVSRIHFPVLILALVWDGKGREGQRGTIYPCLGERDRSASTLSSIASPTSEEYVLLSFLLMIIVSVYVCVEVRDQCMLRVKRHINCTARCYRQQVVKTRYCRLQPHSISRFGWKT